MKNLTAFAFLAFALTGLLTTPVISESFADTNNNGRDKGTKTANGCEKGVAKNNPNCNGTGIPDQDGDGIPDADDACPNLKPINILNGEPDHDGDFIIDSVEIAAGTDPCVA